MLQQSVAFLLRRVIQHVNMLIAGLRANSLYTRQSFEQALDTLLTALSSDALIPDDFQGDGFEYERLLLRLAYRTRVPAQARRLAAHVRLS